MSSIAIHLEGTNNPNIVKFVSNQSVVDSGSYQFNNIDEAKDSELAKQLFQLPFISKVYISANFVALEKYEVVEWKNVQEELKELIGIYISSGMPVVTNDAKTYKRPTEIYVESTPNPDVLKFGTNRILAAEDFEYKDGEHTQNSPLAQALFAFPFIGEVYIAENYISITKKGAIEWSEIMYEMRDFLKNYLDAGKVVIDPNIKVEKEVIQAVDTSTLEGTSAEIARILEEQIRPAVAVDGGNIMFNDYNADTKVVKVVLQGACSGCPSSTITLKNGIETTLKQMLPNQINEVVAING
ncbi:NifU family protein [Flavobacteriaceae bacterium]|nr:NifU family protein [Flavobacteriaceae bacterium]